jgi:hypothetical protein
LSLRKTLNLVRAGLRLGAVYSLSEITLGRKKEIEGEWTF